MKHKLSPWHSADTKPVHVGVYQVRVSNLGNYIEWSIWNGDYWSPQQFTQIDAEKVFPAMASHQNKQWRGIAK